MKAFEHPSEDLLPKEESIHLVNPFLHLLGDSGNSLGIPVIAVWSTFLRQSWEVFAWGFPVLRVSIHL